MEGYGTDSEQIEALKNWWNKNGRYVVAGLVVAALVIGGWRLWDYWQARQAGAAAELYTAVVLAEQKNDAGAVVTAAQTVLAEYPDTAYGALAGLALAKAQFLQQHYAKAEQALSRVMGSSSDRGLATIARLRLARIQLQRGDAQAALATLDKTRIVEAFAVSADTLRGQALLALGHVAEARSAWQRAQAASDPTSGRYQLLAMRIASLPATAPAKPMAETTAQPRAAGAQTGATNAASAAAVASGLVQ